MDMFLNNNNNNNNNNILEPIKIKRKQQIRKPTKDIKTKLPNNINNEPITKITKDIIICNI